MCGRYILGDLSWPEYRDMLSIIRPEAPDETVVEPNHNIAPTVTAPIVLTRETGVHEVAARWGLIPPWFRDEPRAFRATTFNARIETAHEKNSFRASWQASRCLVPATGYYEWTGPKGQKQPWEITLERNSSIFFFAGLYAERRDRLVSYTILTRAADPAIAHLHPRMPVVLQPTELRRWMTGPPPAPEEAERLGTGLGERFRVRQIEKVGLAS